MASLRDEDLKPHILALIPKVDIESTGLKKFMKLLSKHLDGMDISAHKAYIKKTLTEELTKMSSQQKDEEEGEGGDDSEDDDAANETSEDEEEDDTATPKKKKRGVGGGLGAKKEISDKLANFLGKGKEMARTEVVKCMWNYIKEHELQNPNNGQEILLDDAMKEVFGCEKFTMFTMNKYIGAHIDPFTPVDLSSSSTPNKRKRKASPKSSGKKKRKAGVQPPYRLSNELSQITGKLILPRPQVVKKLWKYIHENNLQNPNDRREILCDEKLQAVMKKSKVSMFKMNQILGAHFLEKVDRSLYQHESDADEE